MFNATNDIPAPVKLERRDATFRLVDADGARLDIPADFARKHAISLYEALHPGQRIDRANVSDVEKALTFASQMDRHHRRGGCRATSFTMLIWTIFWVAMRVKTLRLPL